MDPGHQARFSNLVKSDGAGVACLSAAKHRLLFCRLWSLCGVEYFGHRLKSFKYPRYESFRLPLGRTVRHLPAIMIVCEQIALERSQKAVFEKICLELET